jgi:hypothetical protein
VQIEPPSIVVDGMHEDCPYANKSAHLSDARKSVAEQVPALCLVSPDPPLARQCAGD